MTIDIDKQLSEVQSLLTEDRLAAMSPSERKQVMDLMQALEISVRREKSQEEFLCFCSSVWPAFIEGGHHRKMAEKFERVANGQCKRLMINMPPRMGKSQLTSWLLPAWIMGKMPDKKIIMASHTARS